MAPSCVTESKNPDEAGLATTFRPFLAIDFEPLYVPAAKEISCQ
jgi:hypothetical protein